jgi:outer membrane protein with beta-barrel domain
MRFPPSPHRTPVSLRRLLLLAGAGLLGLTAPLTAQQPGSRFFVEGLGGAMVPTFDIADVAKTGWALGATAGYRLNPRWVLMGEFDYGRHKDKATGSTTIKTLHYIAKLGYSLTAPRERGWEALVNLGAGAVRFDIAGAPQTHTYFAINAGAKIAYNFNRSFALVLSPQGDIAFSKKSELTTTNAWVWPFTAGFRANF